MLAILAAGRMTDLVSMDTVTCAGSSELQVNAEEAAAPKQEHQSGDGDDVFHLCLTALLLSVR